MFDDARLVVSRPSVPIPIPTGAADTNVIARDVPLSGVALTGKARFVQTYGIDHLSLLACRGSSHLHATRHGRTSSRLVVRVKPEEVVAG